jgi:low temperature requirement protein LtrA
MTTSGTAGLVRRPEDPQQATFLELFFDLVFVLALAQLSRGLVRHLAWGGALQTLVLLLALVWVWGQTSGLTDRLDPRRAPIQLIVLWSMLGSLVLAAVAPEAFVRQGLVFAVAYVAIHLGRAVVIVLLRSGGDARRLFARQLFWFGLSAIPWVAGALTRDATRVALWALAVAVDYAAGTLRFPTLGLGRARPSEFALSGEHLAERYRQFYIVALGELILVTGLAFGGGGVDAGRVAALLASFATTVMLWRIYIYRAGELLAAAIAQARDPVRVGLAMVYAHLLMVAGVVVTAVGQEVVIAHPLGRARPAEIAVMLGGPALFLAGRALFEYGVFARVSWDRPVGLLLLAAAAPVMPHLPPLAAATSAATVLAGVAAVDAYRARGRPAEAPSPAGGAA